jgi:hypothetical protein
MHRTIEQLRHDIDRYRALLRLNTNPEVVRVLNDLLQETILQLAVHGEAASPDERNHYPSNRTSG